MSFRLTAKRWLEEHGTHAMRGFRHVPFGFRLGPSYTRFRREIRIVEALTPIQQERYALKRLGGQIERVYRTNTFYRRHWDEGGFHPEQLRTLQDVARIPIVTKNDLQEADFPSRSSSKRGSITLNTGGSTGAPLTFTVDAGAFAREWAHMHSIWSQVGFRPRDGRLTIRGHALDGRGYCYNAAHHEYQVDLQVPVHGYADHLLGALDQDRIAYVHGYPSAIAAFLREATNEAPALVEHLRETVTGILLGSEYPHPRYRDFIAQTLEAPTVSWYGHSEMAVLAYERNEPFRYHPMLSYGLAEAVHCDQRGRRLVATTFHNTATPFIRYDTGDLISDIDERNGLLQSFAVAEGRVGEFVDDHSGRRLPLTGLVFGRHHRAFERAAHVQVHQPDRGHLDVYVTPLRDGDHEMRWDNLFDFSGVDMTIRFVSLRQPVRTPSGKTPLLLSAPPPTSEA